MSFLIRKSSSESDFQKMRALCCQTADEGRPIAKERWDFWGEWWIGPYEKLRRDWCWAAEDSHRIVGYLTGSPDTFLFEAQKALRFDAAAFLHFLRQDPTHPDARRMLRRSLFWEPSPFRRLSRRARFEIFRRYPAHLHVNVAEDWRNTGVGTALHEAFEKQLLENQVRGLHVLCGEKAVGYYEKMGFNAIEKAKTATRAGAAVYALGKRL